MKKLSKKKEIVRRYEIGLSEAIINAGIPIRAIFPYERSREKVREVDPIYLCHQMALLKNINTTLYLWDILVKYFDFPFIKEKLFRKKSKNPVSIERWKNLVRNANKDVLEGALLFEKSIEKYIKDPRK